MNTLEQIKNEQFIKEQFIKDRILDDTKDYGRSQFVDKIYTLQQEKEQLKDNWNKLKEHLKENISEERSSENLWLMGCYDEDKLILEKMEELEQESDSNVKD